jgi:hypothetical protein
MNIGMLWFDNDPKAALEVKIARAAGYYHDKYGKQPTLCFIHPSMMPTLATDPDATLAVGPEGVVVRANRSVLPNHFWIGSAVLSAEEAAPHTA